MASALDNLYNAAKEEYDLGTPENFRSAMKIEQNRRNLWEAMSADYDLGEWASFDETMRAAMEEEIMQNARVQAEAVKARQLGDQQAIQDRSGVPVFSGQDNPNMLMMQQSALERAKGNTQTPTAQQMQNLRNEAAAQVEARRYMNGPDGQPKDSFGKDLGEGFMAGLGSVAQIPYKAVGALEDWGTGLMSKATNGYIQQTHGNGIGAQFVNDVLGGNYFRERTKHYQLESDRYQDEKGVFRSARDKEWGKAAGKLVLGVAQNAPNLAASVAIAAAGAPELAAGVLSGGAALDTWEEVRDDNSMSDSDKAVAVLGTFLSEYVFEKLGDVRYQKMFQKGGVAEVKKAIEKEVIPEMGKAWGRFMNSKVVQGLGVLWNRTMKRFGEGITEGATELSEQLLDMFLGRREGLDLGGVLDAMMIGFASDAPIQVAAKINDTYSVNKISNEIQSDGVLNGLANNLGSSSKQIADIAVRNMRGGEISEAESQLYHDYLKGSNAVYTARQNMAQMMADADVTIQDGAFVDGQLVFLEALNRLGMDYEHAKELIASAEDKEGYAELKPIIDEMSRVQKDINEGKIKREGNGYVKAVQPLKIHPEHKKVTVTQEEQRAADEILKDMPYYTYLARTLEIGTDKAVAMYNNYAKRYNAALKGESVVEEPVQQEPVQEEQEGGAAPAAEGMQPASAEPELVIPSEPMKVTEQPVVVSINGEDTPITYSGESVVYNPDGSINDSMSAHVYVFDADGNPMSGTRREEAMNALNDKLREDRNALLAGPSTVYHKDVDGVQVGQTFQIGEQPTEQPSEQKVEQPTQEQPSDEQVQEKPKQYPVLGDGTPDFEAIGNNPAMTAAAAEDLGLDVNSVIADGIKAIQDKLAALDAKIRKGDMSVLQSAIIKNQLQSELAQWQQMQNERTPQQEPAPEPETAPEGTLPASAPAAPTVETKPEEPKKENKPKKEKKPKKEDKPAEQPVAEQPVGEQPAPEQPEGEQTGETPVGEQTTTEASEQKEGEGEKEGEKPEAEGQEEKKPKAEQAKPITNENPIDLASDDVKLLYRLSDHSYHFARRGEDGKLYDEVTGIQLYETYKGKPVDMRDVDKRLVYVNGAPNRTFYLLIPNSTDLNNYKGKNWKIKVADSKTGQQTERDIRDLVFVEGNKPIRKNIVSERTKAAGELKKKAKTLDDVLDHEVLAYTNKDGKKVHITLRNMLSSCYSVRVRRDGKDKWFAGSQRLDKIMRTIYNTLPEDVERVALVRQMMQSVSDAISVWNTLVKSDEYKIDESSEIRDGRVDVSLTLVKQLKDLTRAIDGLEKSEDKTYISASKAMFNVEDVEKEETKKQLNKKLADEARKNKAERGKQKKEDKKPAAGKKEEGQDQSPAGKVKLDAEYVKKTLGRRARRVYLHFAKRYGDFSEQELVEAMIAEGMDSKRGAIVSKYVKLPMTQERLEELGVKTEEELREEQGEVAKKAVETGKMLHTDVEVVTEAGQIPQEGTRKAVIDGKKVLAWFDKKTRKVFLYLPNVTIERVDDVLFHEIVAHKGLRDMLGSKSFSNLCKQVWKGMSPDARNNMIRYAFNNSQEAVQEEYKGKTFNDIASDKLVLAKLMGNQALQEIAADEYMAHLAQQYTNLERTDKSPIATRIRNEWSALCNRMRELLAKIGINLKIDDAGIARYLQESYDNLTSENPRQSFAETEGTRYAIIGEKGALELDMYEHVATRTMNLRIAKQMKDAGKDEHTIKLATGWEIGRDGLWRMEVPDLEIKDGVEISVGSIVPLKDLVDAQELFEAYPAGSFANKDPKTQVVIGDADMSLGDVSVSFTGEDSCYYNNATKTIVVPKAIATQVWNDRLATLFREILIHEVQHAIQYVEGFAEGYSPAAAIEDVKKLKSYQKAKQELDHAKWDVYDRIENVKSDIFKILGVDEEDYTQYNITRLEEGLPFDDENVIMDEFIQDMMPTELSDAELERLGNSEDIFKKLIDELQGVFNAEADVNLLIEKKGKERYEHYAGEVEARNAELRSKMSKEQRLRILLRETEDVAREDQIILINGTYPKISESVRYSVEDDDVLVPEKDDMRGRVENKLVREARAAGVDEKFFGEIDKLVNYLYNKVQESIVTEDLGYSDGSGVYEDYRISEWSLYNEYSNYMDELTERMGDRIDEEYVAFTDFLEEHAQDLCEQLVGDAPMYVHLDAIEASEQEMDDIKKKAIADGTFMTYKGKPTNLSERQWFQVRTQAFKDWFGDWENAPENSSKVLDENGEPLVVYRGSRNADSFTFHKGESTGYFFTPDLEIAKTYIPWTLSENKKEQIEALTDEDIEKHIQPCFLNIRNMKTMNANGQTWNDLYTTPKFAVTDDFGHMEVFDSEDEAISYAYGVGLTEDDVDTWQGTTDGVFFVEKTNNAVDGMLFENIIDTGTEEPILGSVYAIADNKNAKSATKNVGTFNPNDSDIRYSVEEEEDLPPIKPAHAEPMSFIARVINRVADQSHGIFLMQKDIEKITGKKITYDKDVREAVEHASSIVDQALKRFERGPQRRLSKAMKTISKQLEKNGLWSKGMKDSYVNKTGEEKILEPTKHDILERYLMAKDNLERPIFGTNPRMKELAARLRQNMGIEEGAMTDEETLKKFVELFESNYSKQEIDMLWKSVRECTNFSLKWLLKGGVMGQKEYDTLMARQYYVPERGFAQLTNEELREEIRLNRTGRMSGKAEALKKAEGGESMATDVIAHILYLASNSVQVAQQNIVKRAMFDMIQNNISACQQMGYPLPEKIWYVRDGFYEDGTPRYSISMEKPSDEMLAENAEVRKRIASLKNDLVIYGNNPVMVEHIKGLIDEEKKNLLIVSKNDAGDIRFQIATLAGEEIPEVVVSVPTQDGDVEMYTMRFPSRPEIANALNGVIDTKWEDTLQKKIGSKMSALFTVYNPTFFATNLPRDVYYVTKKGVAERGFSYPAFFAAEMANPTTIIPIIEYVSGLDVDSRTGDGNIAKMFTTEGTIEREFYRFLDGGGNTGYTQMNNIKKYRRRVDRMVNGTNPVVATFQFLIGDVAPAVNEASELWTRFAIYRATKAMLETERRKLGTKMSDAQIEAEALHDAKNLSTNFNRRGSGSFTNFFNSLSMFANAQIQGASNLIRTFESPEKAMRGAASIMILPAFVGYMCTLLTPDDDDKEFQVPLFIRENNLVFLDKRCPLSQELIPFYRIGVEYALLQQGRVSKEHAIEAIARGFAEHTLPIPPIESMLISNIIDWIIRDDNYSDRNSKILSSVSQLFFANYLDNLRQLEQNKTFTGSTLRNEFAEGKPQYLFNQDEAALYRDISKLKYRIWGGDLNVPQSAEVGELKEMNDWQNMSPKEIRALVSLVVPSGWQDIVTYAYGLTIDEGPRAKDKPVANKFLIEPKEEIFEYAAAKELKAMKNAFEKKAKNLEGIFSGYSEEEKAKAQERLNRVISETVGMTHDERSNYIKNEIKKHGNDALIEAYLTFGVNLAEPDVDANGNVIREPWTADRTKYWDKLNEAYTKLSIYQKGIKQGKTEKEFIDSIKEEYGIDLGENATLKELRKALAAEMLSEQFAVKGIEHTMPDIQKYLLQNFELLSTDRAKEAVK